MKNNTIILIMILLFATHSNAQNQNYDTLWDTVEKFEKEGLTNSALDIVTQILEQATQSKNTTQTLKSLLYKSKYALVLEEDAQLKIIKEFKTEIAHSTFPKKHILENLLAHLYWQYFQKNRWQFYDRSTLDKKVDSVDFRTWDLETLFNEISKHFEASLQNGLLLQQTPLEQFDALLITEENSQLYRPTLFDFLAHNALAFYKKNENTITKPSYKFEIDDPILLSDAKTFCSFNIQSKDSSALQLKALKIYQNLIQFHLKDSTPIALTDVDIERLKFVNKHATFANKNSVFEQSLKQSIDTYKNNEVSGLYQHELAALYHQQGLKYSASSNTEQRWQLKAAMRLAESVIHQYPKTRAEQLCSILKAQLLQPELRIQTEHYIPSNKASKLLVSYKNIDALNFSLYHLSQKQWKRFSKLYKKDKQLTFIKTLKASKAWTQDLIDKGDYQNHSVEAPIASLSNGHYLIFASTKTQQAFATLQVTNFALVEKTTTKQHTYQIIDRNNGTPIANASVKISYKKNYRDAYTTLNKTTDINGEFVLEKTKLQYANMYIEVQKNNETAYFGNYYIHQYNEKSDTSDHVTHNSFLFTDRSIYRPGQTVYFKGILMETFKNSSTVTANQSVFVSLYNANEQMVSELDFVTNEFGAFNGEFVLPNTGLTGEFYIRTYSNGRVDNYSYFSVEAYKRPKFETQFKPITESFKVNDSVSITGEAIAFAGTTITDAKVIYRVHRKVQYPKWFYWHRPQFSSATQEIAHGETTTNASGAFTINFKAIPDLEVDSSNLPVFNYEITADVTDINGETRSTTTTVKVGYHSLIATIGVSNRLDKTDKSHKLQITTKNLNGEFIAAKGSIKIHKLSAPKATLRKRPWDAPDYKLQNEATFKTLFPHEAYNNEDDPKHWKKGTLVFDKTFDTNASNNLNLGNIKRWLSGQYLITLTSIDAFGQTVKDETRVELYSNKDKTLADNQLLQIHTDKLQYEPGETAIVTISSATHLKVFIEIEKQEQITKKEIVELNNSKHKLIIPINPDDVGGFVLHYSTAAFNSIKASSIAINVPYPKVDLDIEISTFRDKIQPGMEETWSFKIKGPKGNKVSAELLANMYDASLEQFKTHDWNFNPIQQPIYYSNYSIEVSQCFGISHFKILNASHIKPMLTYKSYDALNWFGFSFNNDARNVSIRGYNSNLRKKKAIGYAVSEVKAEALNSPPDTFQDSLAGKTAGIAIESDNQDDAIQANFNTIKIRKNLQETAFFFPNLKTDRMGNVSFSFTAPEALTQWKLQLLAHTKTLESATKTLETVTQKELMVVPNAPRFLREGDQIIISSKISNLSDTKLSGEAKLELSDAVTGADITSQLISSNSVSPFTVDSKGNTNVSWHLSISDNIQAVQYKVSAMAGTYSDGEQNILPVLSNRLLVTESMPMWVGSKQTKTFTLDKLKHTNSSTLKHHNLTLEMTSNPAWYAVQALPYLMEYPYDCNEQTFSRYYANALASHIINTSPKLKTVFEQWKSKDVLLSNLEKNEALKTILIQETPWLRAAQSEAEQQQRIALLFDLNTMHNALETALNKLKQNQHSNGAWAWFNGGKDNRYISQHIIAGFGHLSKLNAINNPGDTPMIHKAIRYLDNAFIQEYTDLKTYNKNLDLKKDHLSHTQLYYLYMRSFFPEVETSKQIKDIQNYYLSQIKKYWRKRSLYSKGLMTLIAHRFDDAKTARKILKSLQETSITSEELGMYWKENTNSWFWYQAPIETQALMIESFTEVGAGIQSEAKHLETIDNLKIWLLKNKQTNRWKTTKATTEAVYALLLQGSDWLSVTDMVDVTVGHTKVEPSKLEHTKVIAGTGYFKTSWQNNNIGPEMADVIITKKGDGIAWGSLYWQYFEDLDKITSADTPLQLNKKLFLKTNTDTGVQITDITANTALKVGDLITVRIELHSDRTMEFVHMKDMRASGLEPINVMSKYKWQDGLGYYESTKDAATNFFFDYLPKGVYVFEYDLRVNNPGSMSNGITTIQSMYAPEFSSHSEGTKLLVHHKP
ncbi:MAG: alpha-2-macroglobulin [Flavobacteriaceae bacterium]|nr:alpha-2-macroglobulin [Flavobacteriaceae bacterium]